MTDGRAASPASADAARRSRSRGSRGSDEGESFDVITFAHVPSAGTAAAGAGGAPAGFGADADPLGGEAFGAPAWRRISKRQAEALVGQALP